MCRIEADGDESTRIYCCGKWRRAVVSCSRQSSNEVVASSASSVTACHACFRVASSHGRHDQRVSSAAGGGGCGSNRQPHICASIRLAKITAVLGPFDVALHAPKHTPSMRSRCIAIALPLPLRNKLRSVKTAALAYALITHVDISSPLDVLTMIVSAGRLLLLRQ